MNTNINDPNYYATINKKLQNKPNMQITSDNEITDKLMNYYDNEINQDKHKNNILGAFIHTKDRIININNDSFDEKNITIMIYKYFIMLLLFIVIVGIGKYLDLYSSDTKYLIFIISFIFYVVVLIYRIYFNPYTLGEYRALKFANDSASSIFKEILSDLLPTYQCPSNCQPKKK